MSSAQVGVVLRQIRKLVDTQHDHEAADHLLLERFAHDRDEDAFATLLRRHGPMVLSVCRSILRDSHDAEDAFQAAFLLLAQKAGSIHRREAVSGWLYRVAYHTAVRAQANAARRRIVEKRAVTMSSADPVLDMSLREVRGILLEELDNLPEQYRAPLVLCGLEEKSREEAARLLGWSPGAVKGKLERGRELLRTRLRRRGLELSSGLCAVALALGSTSRVSAALADSTLRAAVQVAGGSVVGSAVSAKVAALVQGVSKTMFHSKANIAIVLLLALSAATIFGVVWHRAEAAGQPSPQQAKVDKPGDKGDRPLPAAKAKTEAEGALEVRGQVLNPEGKPVAGARLYLARTTPPAPSQQAISGPDGRFRFAVPRAERDKSAAEKSPSQVMAIAKDHGCDWLPVGSGKAELTLRLVKDVPIRGCILDPDGKPVVGAKLRVTGLSAPRGDDLDSYLQAVRKEDYRYAFARDWSGPLPAQPAVLSTGADGRFSLAGIGRERIIRLHLEGPAIATADLEVMTRVAKTVEVAGRRLHGASFDYVAVASRPIRGVVRDKDTRKPLAGVSVGLAGQGRGLFFTPRWMTVTDKEGRYELLGLAKAADYHLAVKPPVGQLYFERRARFRDTRGLAPLTADIDMVQGLTVRGKVTDKATGKPIARAHIEYLPVSPNPHVNTMVAGMWSPRSEATTGADGSYALTALPGPGILGVTGPNQDEYVPGHATPGEFKDVFKVPVRLLATAIGDNAIGRPISGHVYNAMVLLNPGAKDKALVEDVALERPLERKGRVVGPDGKPLSGVTVTGLSQLFDVTTLKGAEFTVRRIHPRAPGGRPLIFYHKGKNLGFLMKELPAVKADPFTVQLQPCGSVSGRIVDQDGEPVAGVRCRGGGGTPTARSLELTTDKKGHFRVEGLVPGVEYWIMRPKVVATLLVGFVVEPGKHKDVGDLKVNID
jgi:RNA polymerase sigma factor (sigma-70 family)